MTDTFTTRRPILVDLLSIAYGQLAQAESVIFDHIQKSSYTYTMWGLADLAATEALGALRMAPSLPLDSVIAAEGECENGEALLERVLEATDALTEALRMADDPD